MLIPGEKICSFTKDGVASKGSWFTGKMNTQTLEFDPLVTGYAFFVWTKLPFWIKKVYPDFASMTQKNFKSFEGIQDMELQTGQYTHTFNGNAYEYAQTITKSNTNFSIRHQEFSGSPIKNMYQFWVSGIRDPETDIAVYPRAFGCEYGAQNHTGELLYIVTRPDANNVEAHNIEFAAFYTAVMPLRIPLQHWNYTQSEHSSPEIEISMVGDFHIGPEVDDFAHSVMTGVTSIGTDMEIVTPYAFITSGYFSPLDKHRGDGNTGNGDSNNTGDSTGTSNNPLSINDKLNFGNNSYLNNYAGSPKSVEQGAPPSHTKYAPTDSDTNPDQTQQSPATRSQ